MSEFRPNNSDISSSNKTSSTKSSENTSKSNDGGGSEFKKSKAPSEIKSRVSSKVKSKQGSEIKSKQGSEIKTKQASEIKSKQGSEFKSKVPSEVKSKISNKAKSKNMSETSTSAVNSEVKVPSKIVKKDKSKTAPKAPERKKNSKEKSGSTDIKKGESVLSKENFKSDKSNSKTNFRIGFIGAGKMADAIVRGLMSHAGVSPKYIFMTAKTSHSLENFSTKYGIMTSTRIYDIFGHFNCEVIFFCVHGFVIRACYKNGGLRPLALATNYIPNMKHPLYLLSLIGGVGMEEIKKTLLDPDDPDKYIVEMHRIVLNTCVATSWGLAVIDVEIDSKSMNPIIKTLLTSIAKYIISQPVQLMDALCTLTGNGLAFVYYFINSISEGGAKIGLNKTMATKLAAKALRSAAQCILESERSLSELQDSVVSIGGPTVYGVDSLNKSSCDAGFQNAIVASYKRLKELANTEPFEDVQITK